MAFNATTALDIDTEEDIISLEEVQTWSLDALKDFCKKRGYKVTGSKKELVARVYVLYNRRVGEQPGAKQQEASRKADYKSLVNSSFSAPDPFSLRKWIGEQTGIKQWPAVSYIDIHWFLKQNGSVGLSREALTAYKTGKAFSYFSCDWLGEVFFSPISKKHECCFLKADCAPSNRLSDIPHSVWAKVVKESGEVVSAYCSCVAG